MKIIAHRGNLNGPDPSNENSPDVIQYCVSRGFDVEIDLWCHRNIAYLGHDEPTYPISLDFLIKNRDNLWVHCKNLCASSMVFELGDFNYFYHENDPMVITSKGYIWTYPEPQEMVSPFQVLLDFSSDIDYMFYKNLNIYGVCVDYA